MPQKSIDPIVTASSIVQSVQAVHAREIDSLKPTAIVFGKIQGGSFSNIIPESVELEGTIRCLYDSRKDENETLCEKFERVVKGVCETHRSEYDLVFTFINPAVVNDTGMTKLVENAAQKTVSDTGQIERYVTMIGEDFCEFVQDIPGAFYFIGVGDKTKETDFPHHHPNFNIDENALSIGLEMHVRSALSYFSNTLE